MRGADHVRQAKQHIGRCRLVREDVEGAAGHMAGLERSCHGLFVDELATSAVDDAHALLRLGDVLGIHDAPRLGRQRRMQRDEISALQQVIELDLLDAEIAGALRAQVGVEGDDAHLEANRALGDDGADVAAADDAEHLGGDLDAHEAVLFPLAGLRGGIRRRNLAGNRKHHGDGVFRRRDRIAEGRVHHDDAASGRCRNVHIVDADAGAANDLEARGAFEELRGDLGVRADGEAIVVADDLGELVLVLAEVGLEVDLDAAILEDLHGRSGQGIGNENARCHGNSPD